MANSQLVTRSVLNGDFFRTTCRLQRICVNLCNLWMILLIQNSTQRSLPKRLWYDFLRVFCRLVGVVMFGIRVRRRDHVPASGGALVLSNHQSHLDPVLVGLATDRRLNYLARDTLFGFAPFRWLIKSLDAIPLGSRRNRSRWTERDA